ncbi:MAG: hypothetical protein JSR54_15615, partial [Proteobacteria bacterium]|nr:hypothetical protein [Pseudomonadota bacterium]
LLLAGGLGAAALARRRPGTAARLVAATGFAMALALFAGGATAIAQRYSVKPLLAAAGPLAPGAPLYTVDTFDWTLPFYAQRLVDPVAYRGELDYGLGLAPARGIASLEEFRARWEAGGQAYALIPHATAARLRAAGAEMHVLAQDFDNVFVSRR